MFDYHKLDFRQFQSMNYIEKLQVQYLHYIEQRQLEYIYYQQQLVKQQNEPASTTSQNQPSTQQIPSIPPYTPKPLVQPKQFLLGCGVVLDDNALQKFIVDCLHAYKPKHLRYFYFMANDRPHPYHPYNLDINEGPPAQLKNQDLRDLHSNSIINGNAFSSMSSSVEELGPINLPLQSNVDQEQSAPSNQE